ncbi:MAG: SpoIIIAH-like family protein [Ruminococcaceae bacterium]|nr:SpoIIIAH-like family protein [Oscillospiraceae bacterium]
MEHQLEMAKKEKRSFKIARRHVVLCCAVVLIAAALVLNFMLFGNPANVNDPAGDGTGENTENTGGNDVTTTLDGYFSATQVSRQRARDEALEVLQSVVDNENADEATKTGALAEIAELAKAMEAEANIESLVISKGFTQCVAIINGDSCSVVVESDGLQQSQISQINEIVYEQAGILPTNIRIITK